MVRNSLLAAGCFLLALAALLPWFVYPQMAKLPTDPAASQELTAEGVTAMVIDLKSPTGVKVVDGAQLLSKTHISSPPGESFPDGQTVWQLASKTYVNGTLLNAQVERVSIDQHSGRLTNCCGDVLFTDADKPGAPVVHVGFLNFPFNVQQRDYPMWDVVLKRARIARFQGIEQRHGIRTYKFLVENALIDTGATMGLPGGLFGSTAGSVDAKAEYADSRYMWVEPATGTPVDLTDHVHQQFTANGRTIVAMDANMVSKPMTDDQLSQIRTGAMLLPWLRGRASYVLIALAVACFVGAGVLSRQRFTD